MIRFRRAANRVILYGAPWMPLGLDLISPLVGAGLASLGLLARGALFRSRPVPVWAARLYRALATLVATLQIVFMVRMVSGLWWLALPAFLFVVRSGRTRRGRGLGLAAVGTAAAIAAGFSWTLVLLILLAVPLFLEWREPGAFEDVHPHSLALGAVSLLALARLWGFFGGTYPFDAQVPAGVAGVHVIELPAGRWIPPFPWRNFAGESCDPDWLVLGGEKGFVALDRATRAAVPFPGIPMPTENYAIDCDRDELFVGDQPTGRVSVYRARPPWDFQPLRVFDTGQIIERLFLDPVERRLVVSFELGGFVILDADSGRELARSRLRGAAYLADGVSPYILSRSGSITVLQYGRETGLVELARRRLSDAFLFPVEAPIAALRSFGLFAMTYLPLDRLYLVDSKDLSVRDVLRLEPGVRHMAAVPTLPVVLVAGYGRGHLFAVDVERRIVLGRVYAGPRIRTVTVSGDGRRAFVFSDQGIVEVDLARALNVPLPAPAVPMMPAGEVR